MASKAYFPSPWFVLGYGWITRPDTKYNEGGVFKAPGVSQLTDPAAQALKDKIDLEVEGAKDRLVIEKGLNPAQAKKLKLYYPYELVEDDQGNPTGEIKWDFKQNATLKLRDGTEKKVKIAVKDSQNQDMHKPVFGGSVIRTMFSLRDIYIASANQVGVRLDFASVQVKKLASGQGGGGFDKVDDEDAYVEDEQGDSGDTGSSSGGAASGSDY